MKIFDNKHYPTIMFLAIIITCLFLMLSFVNIFEKLDKNSEKITGLSISESEEYTCALDILEETEPEISCDPAETKLYSLKSKTLFYLFTLILVVLILMVGHSLKTRMIEKIL